MIRRASSICTTILRSSSASRDVCPGDDGKGNGNHGQYCPNDQPKNHDCGKCPPDGKKKGGDDNCGKCPDDAKKKGGDDNCGKDDGHGHGNDGGGDNGKKGKGK